MSKKTLKGWHKSDVDLDKYLTEPCEIDEDLGNYIGECVAPQYVDSLFTQGGDCQRHEPSSDDTDDIGYYMTVSFIDGKYFYLGILPEFRQ